MNNFKETVFMNDCILKRRKQLLTVIVLSMTGLLISLGCRNENVNRSSDADNANKENKWEYGDSYVDKNEWTEVIVGNLPLVLSIPHGGTEKPNEIADRKCSGAVMGADMNTIQLGMSIKEEMEKQFGESPFLVINHLHRSKIDQNRKLEDAICDNHELKETWELFHRWIDTSLTKAVEKHDYALYIDIHGHGHEKQRLELGYAITADRIKDIYEENWNPLKDLSIYELLQYNDTLNLINAVMGEYSFGTLMEGEGFPTVPSMEDPFPGAEDPYFTGGYNTRRYAVGAGLYPKVFGWQIEHNLKGVRDTDENRKKYAKAFVEAYKEYIDRMID